MPERSVVGKVGGVEEPSAKRRRILIPTVKVHETELYYLMSGSANQA